MTHSGPLSSLAAPGTAAAGRVEGASGGITDIDLDRIKHHAQASWPRPVEFDAFERGVPEADARFPQHTAARRVICQQLRKRKGIIR